MPSMVNPYDNIPIISNLLKQRLITLSDSGFPNLGYWVDYPDEELRVTFVYTEGNRVAGVVLFATGEELHGLPCFDIGYAIHQERQGYGLAKQLVSQSIAAFKGIVANEGIYKFAIEAIVDKNNSPSIKVAEKCINSEYLTTADQLSGTPCYAFQKLYGA